MYVKRVSLLLMLLAFTIGACAQQGAPKEAPKAENATFSVNDANGVLAQFRIALESHSERKLFALIDEEKMFGALSFEDQLRGFLSRNESIRVNIRSIQVTGADDKGVITATFEIETSSASGNAVRRQQQMQFDLARSGSGWRIVDINPRSFFS